jgi:hypothetical protein
MAQERELAARRASALDLAIMVLSGTLPLSPDLHRAEIEVLDDMKIELQARSMV